MAINLHEVDPSGDPMLMEIERQTGPSNFFRAMSHRSEAMGEFARLYRTVMGAGALDRRLKEMVYLAVSAVNECDYCARHHVETARREGVSEHQLDNVAAETDQDFTVKERTALQYARELTRRAAVDRETRNQLEASFAPDELTELTLVICLANFTNRFNNGLDVPLEKERHQTASADRS